MDRIIPKFSLICIYFLILNLSVFAQNAADECEALFEQGEKSVKNKEYRKALEYFTEAEILAEKNDLFEKVYFAKNYMGIIYYNLHDYSEALTYYLDSYTFAIKHLGHSQEMASLNNIGILYSVDEQYEKANEYLTKAYNLAKREKDSLKIGHYAINLGILNSKDNNYIKGKDFLYEALSYIDESEESLTLKALSTLSEIYLYSNNYEESKKIIDKIYDKVQKLPEKDIYIVVLLQLSEYYYQKGNLDKAILMCQKVIDNSIWLEDKTRLYEQLFKIYYQKQYFDKAVEYKDLIIEVKDSIYKSRNNQNYENNKVKFELQTYIQELNDKQKQLDFERKLFIVVVIIFLIFIFLVYKIYQKKVIEEVQKKGIALREKKIVALELENKTQEHLLLEKQLRTIEMQSLLEQEQLQNEVEQKNRQLASKALYLSSRNEIIEELIQSLSKLPEIKSSGELKKIIQLLNDNVKTDQYWSNFLTHFEEVNQGFLTELKSSHPDLNSNDIRFICYVFMDLSTKEICSVFSITQEACRKRKERISKKIGLENGESLYGYLSGITLKKQ